MAFEFKSMTRKELEKLQADVGKALDRLILKEKKLAVAAAEKAAKKHGFSLAEIAEPVYKTSKPKRKVSQKAKTPSVAKYANPDNKLQTWSGKGRRPEWFTKAINAGTAADKMLL
ncbi:H-NS histone family protein [uncultured Roseobacter sp.]|uniref:H-NS histone family protein n=1 Tax=uncultured Roseobacter sp. TaxID=114847 RepID=UPI0026130ECE|nr:H-NS histone family protein [uncultured Roseobacter sp.]